MNLKVFWSSMLTQITSTFHDVSITKLIVGLPPKPCPPSPWIPLLIAMPPPHQEYHIRGCSRLEGSLIGPHIHNVEVDLSEFHFHPIVKAENHLVLCFQSVEGGSIAAPSVMDLMKIWPYVCILFQYERDIEGCLSEDLL